MPVRLAVALAAMMQLLFLLTTTLGCHRQAILDADKYIDTEGNGLPGPNGEPPGKIKKLVGPIELIEANEYSDGGTFWVHLRDSNETEVLFCVSQDMFPSDIPGNTLFVGGTHAEESSSRLPLSKDEATMIFRALTVALLPEMDAADDLESIDTKLHQRLTELQLGSSPERRMHFHCAVSTYHRLLGRTEFALANRRELRKRIARLSSFDLTEECTAFRNASPDDRIAEWQRIQPVLTGRLRSGQVNDVRTFLIQQLGEPDQAPLD